MRCAGYLCNISKHHSILSWLILVICGSLAWQLLLPWSSHHLYNQGIVRKSIRCFTQNNTLIYASTEMTGVNVILYAKYRTGSTFTSQFFAQCHTGLYVYEPLRFSSSKEDQYNISVQIQTLYDIFICNLNGSNLFTNQDATYRRDTFCKLRPDVLCDKTLPFRGAETRCETAQFRVAKVIRVARIQDLLPLMRQGVKVVHLIRDPRGVHSSRRQLSGSRSMEHMTLFCDNLAEDFNFLEELETLYPDEVPKVYHPVHYEDLAYNATHGVKELYQFLGVEPCEQVTQWAQEVDRGRGNTNKYITSDHVSLWGTKNRNSYATSQAWRTQLTWKSVSDMKVVCQNTTRRAGYREFMSKDEMINYNISSRIIGNE